MKGGCSRPRPCSRTPTLVASAGWTAELCSQACLLMSSREGRSEGRRARHQRISCWQSARAASSRSEHRGAHACVITLVIKEVVLLEGTCGDAPPEEQLAPGDLLVVLKGNVPAHHVVQQDAQGPHCGRAAVVPVVLDPLGGAVHPRACQQTNKSRFKSASHTNTPQQLKVRRRRAKNQNITTRSAHRLSWAGP